MNRQVNVGIIGFGTVGTGVVKLLTERRSMICRRTGVDIVLTRIVDKDMRQRESVTVPSGCLTDDVDALLEDDGIDIVCELIGGTDAAFLYACRAIRKGKAVVTANKALLATRGEEIFEAADKYDVDLGFEASVCGGIPVIKLMRQCLVANRFSAILGIINGTSNYILSRMTETGQAFDAALEEAKAKGYAEADPTYDVEGIDAAHKLAILAMLAYERTIPFECIYVEGISNITPLDILFAQEFGYVIKLLAIVKQDECGIDIRVHPAMVPSHHMLASVKDAYNAVYVCGDCTGNQMFFGKGAGEMPTASAVVSDVVDIALNLQCGIHRRMPLPGQSNEDTDSLPILDIEDTESHYYLRFTAVDRPGVLSTISGILGKNNISIASVIQKGRSVGDPVPIVMLTHNAKEKDMRLALTELDDLPILADKTALIRIEQG